MADAIFTSGLFGMFYDSKEASQEKDRKKFNQMIIGALTGVVISAVIFGLTCYIFLN
ncbi:hypothetical protein JCM9140_2745 [Halalkalibacter wakoensis JCM 9140]|uniref:Uncharacterized protein n=2 Tax=Halalkalibacter wakoensis TaxID=127891 RepID=W4Q3J8_9BACI|nr:hypothetical protein JCM9140_2745 [Halalkalibacter wakoensis JCM 9140]